MKHLLNCYCGNSVLAEDPYEIARCLNHKEIKIIAQTKREMVMMKCGYCDKPIICSGGKKYRLHSGKCYNWANHNDLLPEFLVSNKDNRWNG